MHDTLEGRRIEFHNRIPVSYSTKADVSWIKKGNNKRFKLYENKDSFYIRIDDVIRNDYKLVSHTENYSPMDQVISLKPMEKGKVLYKEDISNIINAEIFTDFVGFDSIQPNGLIQTEISHRFYLNRKVGRFLGRYNYIGFINSAKPKITFSKLESSNKVLALKTQLNDPSQYYFQAQLGYSFNIINKKSNTINQEISEGL